MTAPCPVAPEWAVEAWRAIITRHNATKAITTGDADQAADDAPIRLTVQADECEEAADRMAALEAENERLRLAIKPFADCCDQIRADEDDEEWAKFRLLIKHYRAALAALTPG